MYKLLAPPSDKHTCLRYCTKRAITYIILLTLDTTTCQTREQLDDIYDVMFMFPYN